MASPNLTGDNMADANRRFRPHIVYWTDCQRPWRALSMAAVVGFASIAMTGCAGGSGAATSTPTTASAGGTTPTAVAPSPTPAATPASASTPGSAATSTPAGVAPTPVTQPQAATPSPVPALVVVAGCVGTNYQLAQDIWRAAGLIVLPATDALGLHRLPIIDSNWIVVAQNLSPGSKVTSGSAITATVKKYTDP